MSTGHNPVRGGAFSMVLAVATAAMLSPRATADVGKLLAQTVRQQTDEHTRAARLARQIELNKWFHDHGRRLPRDAEPATDEDRRNAAEFHATMSNFLLLRLPPGERRRANELLLAYAQAVDEHGEEAVRALCPAEATLARWRNAAVIKAVSFAGTAVEPPAAVYVPARRTMYLDFNRAVDPAAFADAFEHELWHHLLPVVTPPQVTKCLFWEGFNEALSELWAADLGRRANLDRLGPGKVSYPVAAALASLCLATDRDGTLAWLLGDRSRAEFAAGIEHALPVLAEEFRAYPAFPPERRREVESLLADWNWHEDDGSPPQLDSLLADGALSPDRVATAFRLNRQYLDASIDAMAVVWLQHALARTGRNTLLDLGREALPAPLQENLARVLNYLRAPSYPLR